MKIAFAGLFIMLGSYAVGGAVIPISTYGLLALVTFGIGVIMVLFDGKKDLTTNNQKSNIVDSPK